MAPSGVDTEKATLHFIRHVIDRVYQHGGGASDAEIWQWAAARVNSKKLPMSLVKPKSALHNEQVMLRRLNMAKNTLYDLARSAERMYEASKEALLPSFWHYGIQSLPDEVLSRIFRLSLASCYCGHHSSDAISRVCQKFRRLALSDSSLWSRLTSRMTESCAMLYLERSGNTALTIIIFEKQWSERLKHFIRLATAYASRWRSFHFEVPFTSMDDNDGTYSRNLEKYLGNLYVPMLEDVKVYDCALENENFNFYEAWKMPKLRAVSFSGYSLPSNTDAFDFSAITSFRFLRRYEGFDSLEVLRFIRMLPNLLDLDLCIYASPKASTIMRGDLERVVLPRVKRFSFEVSLYDVFWTTMRCLECPALRGFSLKINDLRRRLPPSKWLGDSGFDFSSVKELDFEFFGRMEPICLSQLYKLFSGLESLNLVAYGNLIIDGGNDRIKIPPLKTLTIRMDPPSAGLFCGLTGRLQRDGRWDGFKRLQVSVESMQEDAEFHMEDKLIWINRTDLS